VELSGLIFVALALVWAVVLLPKALRHHDEVAQTRSVDDLSHSARVLARREAVSEREARLVITASSVVMPAQRTAPPAEMTEPAPIDRLRARIAAHRAAAGAAATKRRRILLLLLVADLGVGAAAALGQLPVWAVAIPVVLTIAFLVTARVTVRREHARFDAELRMLRSRVVPVQRAAESAAPVVEEAVALLEVQEPALVSVLDDTSSYKVGLLNDVAPTTDEGSLWDPLPVTLPTYVGKPRADRSVRTIDLQSPGVASSGHDAASSALVADAATSAPPDDLPQRAVGS
jgi:hypothetical protein